MIFKATVCLYVDVASESEACDAIGEILREHERKFAPESCLVDWHHADLDQMPHPATAQEIASLESSELQRGYDDSADSGQDRESYSDTQDRDSYTVD